ncbi:hypothetical protein LZ30DRAFT_174247 [Colletotrichum cereale]|nr:hypothetical protein LZ30DRAFT_174247 [Colletotrichum cereale]
MMGGARGGLREQLRVSLPRFQTPRVRYKHMEAVTELGRHVWLATYTRVRYRPVGQGEDRDQGQDKDQARTRIRQHWDLDANWRRTWLQAAMRVDDGGEMVGGGRGGDESRILSPARVGGTDEYLKHVRHHPREKQAVAAGSTEPECWNHPRDSDNWRASGIVPRTSKTDPT